MGKKILERVHHVTYGSMQIRVWTRSENLRSVEERNEQYSKIQEIVREWGSQKLDGVALAERIALLEFTNAVEVTDLFTPGHPRTILIYPDWP